MKSIEQRFDGAVDKFDREAERKQAQRSKRPGNRRACDQESQRSDGRENHLIADRLVGSHTGIESG